MQPVERISDWRSTEERATEPPPCPFLAFPSAHTGPSWAGRRREVA